MDDDDLSLREARAVLFLVYLDESRHEFHTLKGVVAAPSLTNTTDRFVCVERLIKICPYNTSGSPTRSCGFFIAFIIATRQVEPASICARQTMGDTRRVASSRADALLSSVCGVFVSSAEQQLGPGVFAELTRFGAQCPENGRFGCVAAHYASIFREFQNGLIRFIVIIIIL